MLSAMSDDPLFKGDVNDQLRAVLRSEFGYSDEKVAAVKDSHLARTVLDEHEEAEYHQKCLAALPGWIAAGYVSADDARTLDRDSLQRLASKIRALEYHHARTGKKQIAARSSWSATAGPAVPDLTRNETLALIAKTVAVVAAQQVAIDELRAQVATLHNYHMAVFGQQQVIEQLTNAPRDFEAVDVMMRLEEQSSTSAESAIVASEQTQGTFESAQNMAAAIEGLASLVAGLSAGRSIDLTELNQATKRLSERSKMHARTRSRGEVRIKIGKVTGGHRND